MRRLALITAVWALALVGVSTAQPYGRVWTTLPAGTEISVRTDEGINSQTASPGRFYPATVQHDVLDENGNVAIPHGADAQLVVREQDHGGRLVLDLDSV